ncbi:hypothetical protein LOK49_LG12G00237 [Camellia lanceoleosa]|uniref:Uncharacterized protein n=1 Tax=Camellia lanceoleosa TaxID=1840588 RepID=A0ACC0FX91_9ERIC|nr:hypothetical protein LOK49_LG12G00237 [Camellia lanceoleosa]
MDRLIKGLIDVALGHNDDRDEERNSESREDRSRSTWAEVVSGEQDNNEPSGDRDGINGIERNIVMAGMRSGNLVDRGLQCDLIRDSAVVRDVGGRVEDERDNTRVS